MPSETLLPCPFCGATDLSVDCSESWPSFVVCRACKTYGPSFEDGTNETVARLESGAIAAWNRRASPVPLSEPMACVCPFPRATCPDCERWDCAACSKATAYCELREGDIPGFGTNRDKHNCPKAHRPGRTPASTGKAGEATESIYCPACQRSHPVVDAAREHRPAAPNDSPPEGSLNPAGGLPPKHFGTRGAKPDRPPSPVRREPGDLPPTPRCGRCGQPTSPCHPGIGYVPGPEPAALDGRMAEAGRLLRLSAALLDGVIEWAAEHFVPAQLAIALSEDIRAFLLAPAAVPVSTEPSASPGESGTKERP